MKNKLNKKIFWRFLRVALEEIKNHYIKEENAWRYFFGEIKNNFITEEVNWIRTLA